jgi:DNA polymerase III subunit epsilon
MRPIYYDTETTGTKPGKDRIIELAAYDPIREASFCTFINPECPIPEEATAISKITNDMVREAPLFKEKIEEFNTFCEGDVVLIAHNNDAFDLLFLQAEYQRAGSTLPPWSFIDSLKWSRKYRSDLPRHGLQFLREAYQIPPLSAHRALDDVLILHQVFTRMVDDLSLQEIMHLLQQTRDLVRMPFGKHQGKPLSEIPKDYVEWLHKSGALDKKENAALRDSFVKAGVLS